MSQQSNFDFAQFNMLTRSAPAGLKMHLALQLLRDAWMSYEMYDNEHAPDIKKSIVDLKNIRETMKLEAEARKASIQA